jgi:DHA1 family tetracycline resistance protein-like MFS transporter
VQDRPQTNIEEKTSPGRSFFYPRKAALAFIFITVMLDTLAIGCVIPVFPRLIESFLNGDTSRASLFMGFFGTVWALMQFLSMPILGSLSDRYGRRPVVLLSNLGLGLDYILMALAPNLVWLFVGRTISGITAASISTATAYIADVTPPDRRAGSFGMIGAAFGLGFILGPAVGGLLGTYGPRLPFWAAAGLSLANFAYGLLVLPESLDERNRSPFVWRNANTFGSLKYLMRNTRLAALAGVSFLSQLAHEVLPSVTVLYMCYRYGLSVGAVGLFLLGVGISSALVQGFLVRRAVAWLGEARVLILGLAAGSLGFLDYALAPDSDWFWAGIPLIAFWGMANPSAQGLMTRLTPPTEQGELQGAIGSLRGVSGLIGPGLYSTIFAAFIGRWQMLGLPGAPFLLAGALLGLAAAGSTMLSMRPAGAGAAMVE